MTKYKIPQHQMPQGQDASKAILINILRILQTHIRFLLFLFQTCQLGGGKLLVTAADKKAKLGAVHRTKAHQREQSFSIRLFAVCLHADFGVKALCKVGKHPRRARVHSVFILDGIGKFFHLSLLQKRPPRTIADFCFCFYFVCIR